MEDWCEGFEVGLVGRWCLAVIFSWDETDVRLRHHCELEVWKTSLWKCEPDVGDIAGLRGIPRCLARCQCNFTSHHSSTVCCSTSVHFKRRSVSTLDSLNHLLRTKIRLPFGANEGLARLDTSDHP